MARTTPPKPWQPGQSGNPKGRPPGRGAVAALRETLAADVPAILKALVFAAKGGDAQAARLVLERVIPALKPAEATQPLALGVGTLTEQGRAVLAAVAAGELAPGQGAQLLGAIGTLARVAEVDELQSRIEALEKAHGNA